MLAHDGSAHTNWLLSVKAGERGDRIPLIRLLSYRCSVDLEDRPERNGATGVDEPGGTALSLNVSAGGMLVIMNATPEPQQVLRVGVPTPVAGVETPTLAEVRWSRKLPFPAPYGLYLVGLKFIV